MVAGTQKKNQIKNLFWQNSQISCALKTDRLDFNIFITAKRKSESFYLKHADSELPSVAERIHSEMFSLTKLSKTFT